MPRAKASRAKFSRADIYAFQKHELTTRATLPMPEDMRKFLRELGERTKHERGRYMDRSVLLRALIAALQHVEDQVDWSGIRTEAELVERFVRAFSKR